VVKDNMAIFLAKFFNITRKIIRVCTFDFLGWRSNGEYRYTQKIKRGYHYIRSEKKPEYESDQAFEGIPEVKLIAFFLPQFHSIPENDRWWGKGFTEWTNTRKSMPRFDGHYQPRTPHEDIGYYDLSDVATLARQAKMAKAHGIYGFCFYYYWFSGKMLLETPINILLEHQEIDIPFCLCWANENWTRRWDGQENEILIKQEYAKSDPVLFIEDLGKYLIDSRYIKIDGKPIILVYCPAKIPNIEAVFNSWRERARELGIGELLIWTCRVFGAVAGDLGIEGLIDGEVQFPPHCLPDGGFTTTNIVDKVSGKTINMVANYADTVNYTVVEDVMQDKVPLYKTCTLQWDNSSRRAEDFFVFVNYSLSALYKWVRYNIDYTLRNNEHKCMFINAWNEWAEGTYLEPDAKYGYANINTVSKALYNISLEDNDIKIASALSVVAREPNIAIHVHMRYTDLIGEFAKHLSSMPYYYDCYITTDTDQKVEEIKSVFMGILSKAKKVIVKKTLNMGGDMGSFMYQMGGIAKDYDYLCHIHSEKSLYSDFEYNWRNHLLTCLLGDEINIRTIIASFEDNSDLGLVFPEQSWYTRNFFPNQWRINYSTLLKFLSDIKVNMSVHDYEPEIVYGNMLWLRTKAVENIFACGSTFIDFAEEQAQLDGTLSNVIEGSWCYIAQLNGYKFLKVNYVPEAGSVTEDDSAMYRKVRLEYLRYKILSKIAFGKTRDFYEQKKDELKKHQRRLRDKKRIVY
jgi:lipopolysaccharide biosynthesis protein